MRICGKCGTKLTGLGPAGLCPKCFLQEGLTPAEPESPPASGADQPPASDLPYPKVHHFGDYELLEEIACGGMGIVHKARQVSLHRIVALKRLLPGQLASEDAVKRFRVEAEAVAGLDHPNIVAIYEVGHHEGQHYFSMQFVDGPNLSQYVARWPNGYPQREAARLLVRVARAVHHAHQRGILHRDLKPANILVDAHGQPHVTDFGLAKQIEGSMELTLSGQVVGTPKYMSPEQAAGTVKHLTTATDIYSLGAVLYFLLTGSPPFEGATPLEVLRKVIETEPLTPNLMLRSLRRESSPASPLAVRPLPSAIDQDLETICLKCLEKDPDRRYPSADALANDLEHWLRHEPIRARPCSRREHVAKWIKRNPALASWIIAAILVAMVGVAGIVWQWRRADRIAVREMHQRERAEATVVRLEMEQAESLFGQGRLAAGIAQLAHSLRAHPDDRVIAERLLCALSVLDGGQPLTASATLASGDAARVGHRQLPALDFVHAGGSAGAVYWAEFSADARHVVTASADSSACVWDARTGRPVTGPLCHQAAVRVARFSPDGRWVATASDDASARVWDATTGQPLTPPMEHANRVVDVNFSPDGNWTITASLDGTARAWKSRTGEPVGQPLQCGKAPLPSAQDVAFAAEFAESILASAGDGISARFSPDGSRVVTTFPDGGVRLWDALTGQRIGGDLPENGLPLSSLLPLAGGPSVRSAGDGVAQGPQAPNSVSGRSLPRSGRVAHLRFSPDGSRLVTVAADGTARVWDARSGEPLTETITPVQGIGRVPPGFSPDGCRVIMLSGSTAQTWDLRSGQPVGIPMVRTNRFVAGQFSPDGARLVLAAVDGTVRLWDVRAAVRVSEPLLHGGEVLHVDFSPDGQWLLTASSDGRARLWEVPAAPSPVPSWLPELAEAVAGERLMEGDLRETVPPERLQDFRQQLTVGTGGAFYAHWARWFFTPGNSRPLSPSSPRTALQYAERRIEEGTLESLREAVGLAPENALGLALLGLAALTQSDEDDPNRLEESDAMLRRAAELAPNAPGVLRARADWLDGVGQPAEALAFLNEALRQHADSPELWQAKGALLAKTNRLDEANESFTHALKLTGTNAALQPLREQLLQQRSDLLLLLKRPADSLADFRSLIHTAYPTARQCGDLAWRSLFAPAAQRPPPERALLLAEKAARLDPMDWRNFRVLGMVRYRAGGFTGAIEAFQTEGRLRHGRLSPHSLLHLALTHHQLSQSNQAAACLRQAEQWWKTTFERLDRSRAKGETDNTVDTTARKLRYGQIAWAMQIKKITQLEEVYTQLGMPLQAQLWGLRSEVERVLGMPMYKHKWKVVSVSYEVPWIVGRAAGAIDENPVTLWHTCPNDSDEGERVLPQEIVVDLGESLELTAFTYLPRQDNYPHGIVDQYEFYLSTDGKDWKQPVAQGTFTNLPANRSMRTVPFARPVTARYFRFVGLHAVYANHLRLAELGVVEK